MFHFKLAITLMALVLAPMGVIGVIHNCFNRHYQVQKCFTVDSNYGTCWLDTPEIVGRSFACASSEVGLCCRIQPPYNIRADCNLVSGWDGSNCLPAS
ncbi:hypothetical protein PGT21_036908 [Puccinia graminis f. sp. tritici]|uniref:CBM1 domain-containing protein n=1 Tax=Puccinia graminis f. sp. tritici TaxID=56615 RepID=A0A5B0QQA3_PUCGR|nr:hypothetical protein PGT21_036908 [Puccinia graminis f. sp. tritici]